MKKLIIILLFTTKLAFSQQVTVNVSVSPPYTPYLLDYINTPNKLTVQLRNNTRNQLSVKVLGVLTGDNGVVVRTRPEYLPPQPLVLNPNETRILKSLAELKGLFDRNSIEIQGFDPSHVDVRGLMEGTYNLCLRVMDYATNQPLSFEEPQGCSNPIMIRYVEPPVVISPACDDTLHVLSPQAVIFTWANAVGTPSGATYTLRLVELPDAEANPNAFIDAVTIPFFEQKNIRGSSLIYNTAMPPLQVGKTYAMPLTAIDTQKRVVFMNEGHSLVCKFTYGKLTVSNE